MFKGLPFFKILRKEKKFEWTEECQHAFKDLKEYLASPPLLTKPETGDKLLLYLAVSTAAISGVLVREGDKGRQTVYYVSRALRRVENKYSGVEKLALALVMTVRKLRPYF